MFNNFDFFGEHDKDKNDNKEFNREKNDKDFSNNYKSFLNSLKERFINWFNSITFTIKMVLVISFILWALNLLTLGTISFALTNFPYYSIYYFQIWRFLTSVLMITSIFSLIFAAIFWVSDGILVEKQQGSVKYFLFFFIHSFSIQLIYALILLIFTKVSKPINYINDGIWSYIMCEVTIMCLVSPENIIYILFIPYPIKAKYYPFLILLMFIFFNGFDLHLFIGLGYGFLYGSVLKKYIDLSRNTIKTLENNIFNFISNWNGFVKLNDITSDNGQPFIGNNNKSVLGDESESESDNSSSSEGGIKKKFSPFIGKGVKLGTSLGQK